MIEQFKYINHLAEVYEFGKEGIFVNYSDLHDYTWDVDTKGSRITSFNRGVQEKKIPIVIMCESESEGITARNRLHEITEKDVLAKKPGRIVVGDYYYTCYVTASEKTDYLINNKYIRADLTLTSDLPYWIKETTVSFTPGTGAADGGNYPDNYPSNYAAKVQNKDLINPDFVASNFRMIIYGQVDNPSITIGGHIYQVNTELEAGSYLIIDSTAKTIRKITAEGTEENLFSSRNRESYIFEKIRSGSNLVAWNGEFNFDVVLKAERSEPLWI